MVLNSRYLLLMVNICGENWDISCEDIFRLIFIVMMNGMKFMFVCSVL